MKRIVLILLITTLTASACGAPSPPEQPPPAPEFRVSSLGIVPKETVCGESVTVTASVENIGEAEGTYHAALILNGEVVETKDIPLSAGGKQNISFKITEDTPGTYSIEVGELADTFKVLKPATFRVTSLDVSPSIVSAGEEATVSINLKNEGEVEGTYSLSLTMDGEVIETKDVTLLGGAMQEVHFSITQESPGTHNIEIDGLQGLVRVAEFVRLRTGTLVLNNLKEPRPLGSGYMDAKNTSDMDAVVVIVAKAEPENPLLAVYIRAHDTYKITVPYVRLVYLYYTCGSNWDDYAKEFTVGRKCMRFEHEFDFLYRGWTVSLTDDPSRAADIEYFDEDEFPKLR